MWAYADADAAGPITPGDMLTTSGVPGHAVRAADLSRANGAVIGKAMTTLEKGRGLVLVLVNLQYTPRTGRRAQPRRTDARR